VVVRAQDKKQQDVTGLVFQPFDAVSLRARL
jgi:hypothetical protein